MADMHGIIEALHPIYCIHKLLDGVLSLKCPEVANHALIYKLDEEYAFGSDELYFNFFYFHLRDKQHYSNQPMLRIPCIYFGGFFECE